MSSTKQTRLRSARRVSVQMSGTASQELRLTRNQKRGVFFFFFFPPFAPLAFIIRRIRRTSPPPETRRGE